MARIFTKECTECYFDSPTEEHKPVFSKKQVKNIPHFSQKVFNSQERFDEEQVMNGLLLMQREYEVSKRKEDLKNQKRVSWKTKVNKKREFIKRCILNQGTLNLAEIARFTKSCPSTVKKVYSELSSLGQVSLFEYNNLKSTEEKEDLDRTIDTIEEGFNTVADLKRLNPTFSKRAILKRLQKRGYRYKLLPQERKNPEERIVDSTRVCRVISHISQAIADPTTTILYIDEMKFPLYQTSKRRWIHKDTPIRDNFVYNRRPVSECDQIVAIALCSTEKFEAVQLFPKDVTAVDFLNFLNEAISHLPSNKKYTIIADNAGWHLANIVSNSQANKFLYFNEPKFFQLNLIENAFSFVRHEFRKRPIVHTQCEEAKEIASIFFLEKNKERFKGVFRNHLRMLVEFLEKHKPN